MRYLIFRSETMAVRCAKYPRYSGVRINISMRCERNPARLYPPQTRAQIEIGWPVPKPIDRNPELANPPSVTLLATQRSYWPIGASRHGFWEAEDSMCETRVHGISL